MQPSVQIGNHIVQTGKVSIFVPLLGRNPAALAVEAAALSCCDVIEWRVDFFENFNDFSAIQSAHRAIREASTLPILFTWRTKGEGGEQAISEAAYFSLLEFALSAGLADALDVELLHDSDQVQHIVDLATKMGIPVILSNHDFLKTPADSVIEERLSAMGELNASIAKIAYMPQCNADVLRMLQLPNRMSKVLNCPIIAISMGKEGLLTRVAGGITGSCVSFGTNSAASAPGQIPACELRQLIDLFTPKEDKYE